MSIREYCTKLKRLADNLRDIDHPVSEPSQVLNLLRGLHPKYRHVKPVIKSKSPPHTFASAYSYLLLEEVSDDHDSKMEAGLALVAGHSISSTGGSSSTATGSSTAASGSRSDGQRPKSKNLLQTPVHRYHEQYITLSDFFIVDLQHF
ncbi:uncharacterized protein LOC120662775 [Panicum virgatum]|uniref:uncharacterized protein LOC120662775 n=1 Tax=Panicum virgatum TaxID=38727 RepID=UPI0019D6A768|nr:uncharacterized protein LOC120662775 [Panicum virgatum]